MQENTEVFLISDYTLSLRIVKCSSVPLTFTAICKHINFPFQWPFLSQLERWDFLGWLWPGMSCSTSPKGGCEATAAAMNPVSLRTRKQEQLGKEWAREGSVSYVKYGNGWGTNALRIWGKDRRNLRSPCGIGQEFVSKAAKLSSFKYCVDSPGTEAWEHCRDEPPWWWWWPWI